MQILQTLLRRAGVRGEVAQQCCGQVPLAPLLGEPLAEEVRNARVAREVVVPIGQCLVPVRVDRRGRRDHALAGAGPREDDVQDVASGAAGDGGSIDAQGLRRAIEPSPSSGFQSA